MNAVFKSGGLKKSQLFVFFLTLFAIPASAIEYDCLQPRLVGVCIWIVCSPYGCSVSVTPKIGHFNPDVLVQITNEQGVDRVEDPKRTDTHNRNHNNLIFQSAKAFGHPLTGQIYCPSNTTALSPYFFSPIDIPSWRFGGLDLLYPGTYVPGFREVGVWPLNTWGALYPRIGFTTQHSEPKASAVVSQRVGDIITRRLQPHIYLSILGQPIFIGAGKLAWSPGNLLENTNLQGWWELMPNAKPTARPSLPSSTPGMCQLFGQYDVFNFTGWGGGKVSPNGEYLYSLWRPYKCCQIKAGALIVIDFSPYPIPVITNP